jgi:hypothetical protein
MPAHEYLNGEQLSMFLPAHVLMGYASAESKQGLSLSEDKALHDEKLRESKANSWGSPLVREIKEKRGIEEPVEVWLNPPTSVGTAGKHTIMDGHHRVTSANYLDPNMEVPVDYY